MAQAFVYKGRDSSGAAKEGVIEAASTEAVATELLRRGITPVKISQQASGSKASQPVSLGPLFQKRVGLDELIIFSRQMYALMKAGIPIIRAMRGLADTSRSPALAETLDQVTDRLETGVSLGVSMRAHPKVFSDLFVNMILVGENTGQLDEAFLRISKILELERETRKRVAQALRYPIFVVVALVIALLVVNLFVIPQFATVFAKFGADLPLLTKLLVTTSDFMINYWWVMLIVSIAGVSAFIIWKRSPEGHYRWDKLKFRIPIIGPLLELVALSRFARNISTTLAAGMPVTQALTVVADAVDNEYIGDHLRKMRTAIERGDSLLRAAAQTGLFTPLIIQMLSVGEETGQVDQMLANVADFYDEEVDYSLKRLAESIEPILLVAMGILVLILALGVFLPIWDLGKAALGK